MIELSLGLAIAAILFSLGSLIIGIFALSYVIGLRNSTHQIQFVPANEGLTDREVDESFSKSFSTSFDDEEVRHV